MNERPTLWASLAGIGLVALCCGGPLLIGAIGALSASALLGWATHIVLPAAGLLAVVVALVFYLRFRRARAAHGCCEEQTETPVRNLR
jgi:membrane protein implicated in regulation of membrane protease activity